MSRKASHGHPLTDGMRSKSEPPSRADAIVQHIVDNYSGDPAIGNVSIELRNMGDKGVTLTVELVDYLFKREGTKRLREWYENHQNRLDERAASRADGYVYFIEHGDRVKIGYSIDPAARAVALSLRPENVVAVIQGSNELERSLHRRFAAQRIGTTEWFHYCDEIREHIDTYGERFTKHHRSRKAEHTIESGYLRLARAITGRVDEVD